jgi:hypothetical protein
VALHVASIMAQESIGFFGLYIRGAIVAESNSADYSVGVGE